MSTDEVQVGGTLRADGTLQLDHAPNISPGRVMVILRRDGQTKSCQPLSDAFFRMMEEIWAAQTARRFVPQAAEHVEAGRNQLQAEADEEIEAAVRLQEESRRLRAQVEDERHSP